ncbi:MAG: hypothetical protein ABI740_01705 [Alphaproteobacteria bacterium]
MNKYVLAATLTAGLAVVGAPSFAQVSGTVGANYSRTDTSGPDTDTYGVNGGVTIPTSGNLAVLVDGSYAHNDDADIDAFNGTAHLITRNESNAFGGYVGFAHADVGGGGDADAWSAGGEYAKFFKSSTLALTLGYAKQEHGGTDASALIGEYRIFASDNLRFDINAGYAHFGDFDTHDDGTEIGAGVEYRFGAAPISLGAAYTHYDSDFGNANVLGVSLRYDFGNGSLKARDRTGNTFGALGGVAAFLQ